MRDELKKEYNYLLWLLSRRDYPEKTLLQKLKKRDVTPEDSKMLLALLKENQFFCESRYQKSRARQLIRRGESTRTISAKIKNESGTPLEQDDLKKVFDELGTSEDDALLSYLQKEHNKLTRSQRHSPQEIQKKLIERAMRRGFHYEQIKKNISIILA